MALGDEYMTVGVAGEPKEAVLEKPVIGLLRLQWKGQGKDRSPDYFYMVAPSGEEEFYLKGITEVIGRVPFSAEVLRIMLSQGNGCYTPMNR